MKLSEIRKLTDNYISEMAGKLNPHSTVDLIGKFTVKKVEGFTEDEIVDLYLVKAGKRKYVAALMWLGNNYGVAGMWDFEFTGLVV